MKKIYLKQVKVITLLATMFCLGSSVLKAQIITTVAGGFVAEGATATSAAMSVSSVAIDTGGNKYIADSYNHRIRKISKTGIITTIAGNGIQGYTGDSSAATAATLNTPSFVTLDAKGNIYIVDKGNNVVRKIAATTGIITTVAGNGIIKLNAPAGVAVDAAGNLYIADQGNNRIRKVSTTQTYSTVAGNGVASYGGDGGKATSTSINAPSAVAVDAASNIYIADYGNNRIRKVDINGTISTIVGNGTAGYSGDGGLATTAKIFSPKSISLDALGNIYIVDFGNNRIRKVETNGIINTIVGNGLSGFSGDGSVPTSASLNQPYTIAVDAAFN